MTAQVHARREVEQLYNREQEGRVAVETAYDAVEAVNRAKGEFLAVMSNELGTPLNAVGGCADLIEMGIREPVTPLEREDLLRIPLTSEPDLCVRADPGKLRRSLVNLLSNALEFTDGGGRIAMSSSRFTLRMPQA